MANDSNQNSNLEDEINFQKIIQIVLDSKKIIFASFVLCFLLSIYYMNNQKPSFETTAILEIGNYGLKDNKIDYFEKPTRLLKDLRVDFLYIRNDTLFKKISLSLLEDKFLKFNLISNSAENNEKILSIAINSIKNRHSLLKKNKLGNLNRKLTSIESEISFKLERLRSQYQIEISDLERKIPIIDKKINYLDEIIIMSSNNLMIVQDDFEFLEEWLTLEKNINQYKQDKIDLEFNRTNSIEKISQLKDKLRDIQMWGEEGNIRYFFDLSNKQKELKNEIESTNKKTIETKLISQIESTNKKHNLALITILGFFSSIVLSLLAILFLRALR
jgi:hypothetical protein